MSTPDPQTLREIPETAIRAHAAELIRDYATGLDYLDLAEYMADHDTIGGILIADLDGPEIDNLLRRILHAAHSAAVTSSWPDEQQPDDDARSCVDSHSPWSEWLTDHLLDREWLASGLVEASGHVFDAKQVSRWLHSQDVPEPWAAVVVAKAFGTSVIKALRAAEHGVMVDAVLEEAKQPQDDGADPVTAEQQQDEAVGRVEQAGARNRRLADAYTSGWHDAIEAYRTPGWAEREAGWRKYREQMTADAAQDGLSATETDDGASRASGSELECERPAVGLSEPEPCDGDCDCDCQPGQPCLCPERDCYCGPCRVCDRDEDAQQPDDDTEGQ